jgi:non-specific serine/threonine protein kinase/protein-serine/threonine kinase
MARQLAPGDVIGGFRLEQKFHHGGLGTLWKVSRADIAAPLVMKLPFLLPGEDALTIVSYETEQMIMPRLSGSHVPAFIAAGDFDGPYVVMELIAGRPLLDRLPGLPLPAGEVADLGARIADALEDIHRQRVIHLDLKPSNIMIRDAGEGVDGGEVVLLDFGLARHLDLPDLPGEELEGPIGTGVYIAPEQLLDVRNDRRSDLFALGVLMYFFATGKRPFGEPRTVGRWRKRLTRAPLPPRRLRPELPPWLQEIILHCLEVDPRQRYQAASHLAFDLRHPELVRLSARAERTAGGGMFAALSGWLRQAHARVAIAPEPIAVGEAASIIVAAVDLGDDDAALTRALRPRSNVWRQASPAPASPASTCSSSRASRSTRPKTRRGAICTCSASPSSSIGRRRWSGCPIS